MMILNLIGWSFLVMSWVIPYIMKQMNEENRNRYAVGMILSVVALIIFVIGLVVSLSR